MNGPVAGHDAQSPIFVTGMPRSGTTFVQHLLTTHSRITIHGQEPVGFSWGNLLKAAVHGVGFADASNEQLGYEAPHYAAPDDRDRAAVELLDYARWYLTGGQAARRWGAKSLTQCRIAADIISEFWPQTCWVVCIRNPFSSIQSLRNTYDKDQCVDLATLVEWWTDAVRFAHEKPAAMPVQFDRLLSESARLAFVERLFDFVGETPTPQVIKFAEAWEVIHKVTPDDQREYTLSNDEQQLMLTNEDFAEWVSRLGYHPLEAELV